MANCPKNFRSIMFAGRCSVKLRIVAASRQGLAYEPGVP